MDQAQSLFQQEDESMIRVGLVSFFLTYLDPTKRLTNTSFVNSFEYDRYLCPICSCVLVNPLFLKLEGQDSLPIHKRCSHRFCSLCFREHSNSKAEGPVDCPVCRREVISTDEDVGAHRDISSCEVYCPNVCAGDCNKVRTLCIGDLDEHCKLNCPLERLVCIQFIFLLAILFHFNS